MKDGLPAYYEGPVHVLSVRKILPQGEVYDRRRGDEPIVVAERKRSLVQLYTDPGGIRTLAAADIWLKDPARADRQW
jgi:hypothetical protein